MGIVVALFPRLFSLLGISLIGALSHNIAQIFLAYLLFIRRIEAILIVAPMLILAGTLTGSLNGIASRYLVIEMEKMDMKREIPEQRSTE